MYLSAVTVDRLSAEIPDATGTTHRMVLIGAMVGCPVRSRPVIAERRCGESMHCGSGTQQRLVAPHQQDQCTAKVEGDEWQRDCGHDAPNHQRMPLPLPNVVEEAQGMMAEMLDLLMAKRQPACVKEVNTQFDERQKQ